ncbi:MAG: arsenate reductase [Rhodospirillales bacterium CG15_BIG_FIL_POST_REV_8_21_14_020_66_15]|nr:MAG: arsenate reductase [Rhodospirillales bacterium CG15_BIG_FIL_POST_REV_8_21_14_020_66_15]
MLTVWGLKTCDTCKKALKWLADEGIAHAVKDVRGDGVPPGELARWLDAVGWETLVNKSSTTWRGLDDADKEGLDAAGVRALLAAYPTLIKRPVFVSGKEVVVGFRDAQKQALRQQASKAGA